MKNIILCQGRDHKVELGFNVEKEDVPSKGDAQVNVVISSHGLSGRHTVWVEATVVDDFSKSLVEVLKARRGQAVLTSISPNELTLSIEAVGRRGHVAICGQMSHIVRDGEHSFQHSMTFGFEIDAEHFEKGVGSLI